MKFNYLVVILAIGGILGLYWIGSLAQPETISLQSVPTYEGKKIITEGIVTNQYTTSIDTQIIEIKNLSSNASTKIFLKEKTIVDYGDLIQVTGQVQKYKQDWEIVTENKQAIFILRKWQNISIPISQIAVSPDRYTGLNIKVSGIVEECSSTSVKLCDSESKYKLSLRSDSSFIQMFSEGSHITVSGVLQYDEETLTYVLFAQTITPTETPERI